MFFARRNKKEIYEKLKKEKEKRFNQILKITKEYKIYNYEVAKEIGIPPVNFCRWKKGFYPSSAVMYALEAAVEKIRKEKIANLQIDKLKK